MKRRIFWAIPAMCLLFALAPLARADKPPVSRAVVFNGSAPGANTDILSAAITPQRECAFRVTVALTTASVFNVTCTDGNTTHAWGLNSSTALQAADLYAFTFAAAPSLSYNFQVETDGVIEVLIVEEIQDGEL